MSKLITYGYLAFVLGSLSIMLLLPEMAVAADIKKPGFIDDNGKDVLDDAGKEIMDWIAVAFGVATAIAGALLGFLALKGKMEEMWERFQNIIIGVMMFLVSGTIIFAII